MADETTTEDQNDAAASATTSSSRRGFGTEAVVGEHGDENLDQQKAWSLIQNLQVDNDMLREDTNHSLPSSASPRMRSSLSRSDFNAASRRHRPGSPKLTRPRLNAD